MKITTTENLRKVGFNPRIGHDITEPGVYARQSGFNDDDVRLIVIGHGSMQVKIIKVGDYYEKAAALLDDLWIRIPNHAITVTFTND